MNAHATARRIGLIIVGDEILSGRRQDQHFSKIVAMLAARGLQLSWVELHGDDREALIAVYRRSFASGDIVISCGGIGATPDDHTRQAAAAALGVDVALHPEAEALIAQRCAEMAAEGKGSADMTLPENRLRLKMGEFPQGAEIVPNPFNRIPGFFVRDHTFVPGFPVMAWPMIEWTLDNRYADLHHAVPHVEHSFLVFKLPESAIIDAMETVERQWPGVKAFSLPSVSKEGRGPHIELGVKGSPELAALALDYLRTEAQRLGGEFLAP